MDDAAEPLEGPVDAAVPEGAPESPVRTTIHVIVILASGSVETHKFVDEPQAVQELLSSTYVRARQSPIYADCRVFVFHGERLPILTNTLGEKTIDIPPIGVVTIGVPAPPPADADGLI